MSSVAKRSPVQASSDQACAESTQEEVPAVEQTAGNAAACSVAGRDAEGEPAGDPAPVAASWVLEVEAENGSRGDDVQHVRLGETLWLVCTLADPKASVEPEDVVVECALVGLEQGAALVSGNRIEVPLYPSGIGPASAQARLTIATAEILVQSSVSHIGVNEMQPGDFNDYCGVAGEVADAHYATLEAALLELAEAYSTAYSSYTGVLDAVAESRRVALGLLFDASVAFLAGMGGALAANALMSSLAVGKVVADGVKDLVKFGFKAGVNPMAGKLAAPIVGPLPQSPDAWSTAIEGTMLKESALVHEMIADWGRRAVGADREFFLDFNPDVELLALKMQGLPIGAAAAGICPDAEGTARNFELGFWSSWMSQYAFEMALHGPPIGTPDAYVEESVPAKVKDRLAALGADPDAFVAEHGQPARDRAEEQKREYDEQNPMFPWQ
jgi:hypothetical protein